MKLSLESVCVLLFVCVAVVFSAPAKKNSDSARQSSLPSSSIQQQENELERLAKLAAHRLSHSIGVQNQNSFHYTNINGKENSESNTEEKVVNPETGDVVSDIRHKTKQDDDIPVTQTKIEIPSENIDETFVESNPDTLAKVPLEKTDFSDEFKYTPVDVAKYLYQTGNFEELTQALKDLVNSSIMTEKQAVQYKDDVRAAYNQLVQSSLYTDVNELPMDNTGYEANDNTMPSDVIPGYNYYNELLPYGGSDAQEIIPETDESNGISDLVNTLMDEWLTRTVLTGDRDAETMLSEIWDSVSKDDNPDDLGQMREILVDIFTSEIIDGLTSDVNYELPYYTDLLTNGAGKTELRGESQADNKLDMDAVEIEKEITSEQKQVGDKVESKPEEDLKHLKM